MVVLAALGSWRAPWPISQCRVLSIWLKNWKEPFPSTPGIDISMSFHQWLERRDPALRLPKAAREYATSLTHPVVVRLVQKDMDAEAASLRQRMGMKRDRHSKPRRGL